ncbi:L-histidine N(alpha)-methyltransferase [Ideonella sp. 4Y11]|uniref:L-histidine N(Alpha)-methyltransferase n=1 Tax=Ideonella aquatica TaxID=2824119 RepID=A0A941BR68_9BURK|nr:L-histidine N(alpha)-methyltransferase [Ideonella aquatica]MBQ0960000.1 L-histidine N(alpha)-methyltransferase [Ideonella aquatica]
MSPLFLDLHQIDPAALAREAALGLLAQPAAVSPKFFYDALGSRLFEAITALDEYYLTRTEAAIFERHGAAIAAAVHARLGPRPVLVEPGAGSCRKAASLFGMLRPRRYVALDISVDYLREALWALQPAHPALALVGVGLDFSARLALPPEALGTDVGPSLVFYPGSSIGNFAPAQALRLLREARALSQGGALLIGVDRVKPAAVLNAAYDDALGVTAAFNLNLLRHLNRVLGSDFRPADWRHIAFFDVAASRIEMHLEARHATAVHWPGGERHFMAGDRLLTEHAYKWTPEAFEALLHEAGYRDCQHWSDDAGGFSVMLAA